MRLSSHFKLDNQMKTESLQPKHTVFSTRLSKQNYLRFSMFSSWGCSCKNFPVNRFNQKFTAFRVTCIRNAKKKLEGHWPCFREKACGKLPWFWKIGTCYPAWSTGVYSSKHRRWVKRSKQSWSHFVEVTLYIIPTVANIFTKLNPSTGISKPPQR